MQLVSTFLQLNFTINFLSSNFIILLEGNKFQLKEAFSLLAYRDPKQSPIGYLLDPSQREQLCADLNSAILGE